MACVRTFADSSVQIINMVKSKPELYDSSHPDYPNKRHHIRVWEELARQMGIRVQIFRSKWNSLRNSYARCIRTQLLQPDRPRTKWYLETHMDFLKCHVASKIKRMRYLQNVGDSTVEEDSRLIDSLSDFENETQFNDSTMSDSPITNNVATTSDDHYHIEQQPLCDDLIDQNTISMAQLSNVKIQPENHQYEGTANSEFNSNFKNDVNTTVNVKFLKRRTPDFDELDMIFSEDQKRVARETYVPKKVKPEKKVRKKSKKPKKFDQIFDILNGFCSSQKELTGDANSDSLFFQSIEKDYVKLSEKRKRKFKSKILSELNDLLDESELENDEKLNNQSLNNCK